MSDRQRQTENEDAEQETTDFGEGERGIVTPSRGGTFAQTPGETGDRGEDPASDPGAIPPRHQEQG
jgi:hypothetical protein